MAIDDALPLDGVLAADAAKLLHAASEAKLVHGSGDIDASGDVFESAVRSILKNRLPSSYYVGNGKIIDSRWTASPQTDVIIADTAAAPVLFKTDQGVEFFPFEAVYAVGEIKVGYHHSKRPIHGFCNKLSSIRLNLSRPSPPEGYLRGGIRVGGGLSSGDRRRVRNPLFSFIVFADSNTFKPSHIADLYLATPWDHLPNLIIFLEKGVIACRTLRPTVGGGLRDAGFILDLTNADPIIAGEKRTWTLCDFGSAGSRWGVLQLALSEHLRECVLFPPNLREYFSRGFKPGNVTVIASREDGLRSSQ